MTIPTTNLMIIAIREVGDILKVSPERLPPNLMNETFVKIKSLLDSGTNINETDWNSKTPLHFTVENGCIVIANFLIKNGADVNRLTGLMNWSPLYYAARNGDDEMIKLLISANAKVSTYDRHGKTPLAEARGKVTENIINILKKKMEEEQQIEKDKLEAAKKIEQERQIEELLAKLSQLPLDERAIKTVYGNYKLIRIE